MNKTYKILLSLYFVFTVFSVQAIPWVISHRGGGQNFPENTILAFSKSLEMGCDALELDVQVTRDGIVAVYHPDDLSQWTNSSGPISSCNWNEVIELDAGYNYKAQEGYPFRDLGLRIPKLDDILKNFPNTVIIIDMKSLPAEPLVKALTEAISDEQSKRLIFYSTNTEHIDLLNDYKPHWNMFEKRDITRQRLLELNQTNQTNLPLTSSWVGFELKRKMTVTETFALGKGTSVIDFQLWSPSVIAHLKKLNPNTSFVLFGINTTEEWEKAVELDVDAVYTDNPARILQLKNIHEIAL